MTHRPSGPAFPVRLGRRLTLTMGAVVLGVLVVGGLSLGLAFRTNRNNEAVMREYDHIRRAEEVHALFHDLVFELHQAEAETAEGRASHAQQLDDDLGRQIQALAGLHGPAQGGDELVLGELRRLVEEARALTSRLAASGRFAAEDIEWLDRATHLVARKAHELGEQHRAEVERRLEDTRDSLRAIVLLYAAFIVVGGALIGGASIAATRRIALPLRWLADAAGRIAEGGLDARVRVESRDEVGQLSQAFNLMADRLEAHDEELRAAHAALEDKVRETKALYRIGTEISRLNELDRVLQSVVDRARELVRCDAVALFLAGGDRLQPRLRATSGPADAFTAGLGAGKEPPPVSAPDVRGAIRPEYARASLAAPLRLGDEELGTIQVASREEREFTAAEAELLGGLATQAAIAIERARLSEEVRSLAAVEERGRIAREMHDGLAQALGALHVRLQAALARPADAAATAQALREMVQIVDGAYEDVRQSIFELRTFVSRGLGLVPTLTEYLHDMSDRDGLHVELEASDPQLSALPPASEVQAVRIIQEALANVRKHAQARSARVSLHHASGWLHVAVEDDGKGWDPQRPTLARHYGLQTMRERAEALGGRLEIDTAPGRGTRVVAKLPGGAA